jgi:hypothetical protein
MCELDTLGFDVAAAAGWYSAIAGLLAGFALLAVLLPLDHETKDNGEQADRAGASGVIVFTSAFFALLVLAFTYAILSGRPQGAVAVHEQQLSGTAFGLASLLMILGLREVLRMYGGNRAMLAPASALIARVTGIFGPIIVVAFTFSNALDVEAYRAKASPTELLCVAGMPSGVWINAIICLVAALAIALLPLAAKGRTLDAAAAAAIGHATLAFTVSVAVWTAAIVPFLPVDVIGGALIEHTVVAVSAAGAVGFGATAWLSRSASLVAQTPRARRPT